MNDKPINILLEEVKEDMGKYFEDIIQKYDLNFYLLEIVLRDLYHYINELKNRELEETKKSLENKKKEE